LAQAQKMEGIGQLTGGVAHDFNNLLTVITGNLDSIQRIVQKKPVALERIERAAGFAMTGAQRATALTQRLLAFARRQPLDPKSVNVSRLVMGMSEMLRRTLGEQIAIETVLAGGLWQVLVDPNQLEISIVNLAVNARHAMPDGGRLTIETANTYLDESYAVSQSEVVPGQYVVICVSDSGVGMSPEVLSRAFEPFFTTKEIGQGTGLGLSQVYGFVKQSGGHVKIYSELGQGTTVKLYLPRLHSSEDMAEPTEIESRAPGAAGETILVVEDDNDVRAYTTSILSELGYAVLEAATGASALRVLESHPEIELLFTDVGLPGGMNGRQLADAARQLRPTLKILFTTGYARNAIVHDGRLDPGVVLITKPFSYAALAAKLRDVLDRHAGPRRILLVEDEPLAAMVAADYLEELGYKVEVTSTATEAINRAKLLHGAFDFAVIDIGLPDRSGDVLVRELRMLYPALKIAVASGQQRQELHRRLRDDACVLYIEKPYTFEQLQKIVPRAPG
jgi:CheY-like chemotaxis protein